MKKAAENGFGKMPRREQGIFKRLIDELADQGPVRDKWPNYSKLGNITHHCHLSRKWVACWRHENDTIEIEVYYAGSRESAPY